MLVAVAELETLGATAWVGTTDLTVVVAAVADGVLDDSWFTVVVASNADELLRVDDAKIADVALEPALLDAELGYGSYALVGVAEEELWAVSCVAVSGTIESVVGVTRVLVELTLVDTAAEDCECADAWLAVVKLGDVGSVTALELTEA